MLGYIPSSYDDIGHFEYNEDNPLDTDVIIIDEMSMVDVVLFEKLLRLPQHLWVLAVLLFLYR